MMNKTLKSFVDYCEKNPHQRFWQALASWSGINFIYASKYSIDAPIKDIRDTFYIEDK